MVSAIQFVVRDSAGEISYGSVAGDAQSNLISAGVGNSISLNVARQDVIGYQQQGQDLVITLADGRTLVLSGYFSETGEPAGPLYLSSNGEITEVVLANQDGVLFADYGPIQGWDKWSPLDDLRFTQGNVLEPLSYASNEPAGMAPLIPGLLGGFGGAGAGLGAAAAAAVAGGALLAGGLVGGSDGSGRVDPKVDPRPVDTLTTNTTNPSITVSGTGQPGDKVLVTVGGKTEATEIKPDGKWAVTYPPSNLPGDGNHTPNVVVTTPEGKTFNLIGTGVVIDMTPPPVSFQSGVKSSSDVENLAEYQNGVTITGKGEPGAAIEVKVGTALQTTTVASDGSWAVTFTQTQVAGGEYETGVTVKSTDVNGNTTLVTDTLVMDTVPHPITFNAVTADNTVSFVENGSGLVVTGASTAGASLSVVLNGVTQTAIANANGVWTVTYPVGTLANGEYSTSLTATTTDLAGNVSTKTHSFNVDTQTQVAFTGDVAIDGTVNAGEAASGVVLTGTAQPGSSVNVAWNGTTLPAVVAANGTWSVAFSAGAIPAGTYASMAVATATDAFGNSATTSKSIQVDTQTSVTIDAQQSGTDNLISGAERNAGVTLTGTAEPNARVEVTFEGVTKTVSATAAGTWSASYATSELRAGSYGANVTVKATDAAGNQATASHMMQVDTQVVPLTRATLSTGTDTTINFAEAQAGVVVTGTVEPGSTVMVSFGSSAPRAATVAANGTWTVTIPAADLPSGENNLPMQVLATDRVGNTATLSETVRVDTLVRNFNFSPGPISGDGYVNAQEAAAGLTLTGTAEPGATVILRLASGAMITATVAANGDWHATIPSTQVPRGEGSSTVSVLATDAAGNTKVISTSFVYDTVAPDSPDVTFVGKTTQGAMRGLNTHETSDNYSFSEVKGDGSVSTVSSVRTHDAGWDEAVFNFGRPVPDGSYLVINTADNAGNNTSTLLIVNNTDSPVVDLGRAGLAQFDFSTIDLSVAPEAQMTITAQQLAAITGPDQSLMIKGDALDTVTLVGGTDTGATHEVDGQSYKIFSLGNTGTVLVDDDILTRINTGV